MKSGIRSRFNGRARGVALLSAMLTVTLVATLTAAALWRQWRSVEVETAERAHQQTVWLLAGAQDWARLILMEDLRSGNVDHLGEPWAVPLQQARLSSFLAADQQSAEDMQEVFLSGQIADEQSRLNVLNLVEGKKISDTGLQDFGRLFAILGLPAQELTRLAINLQAAINSDDNGMAPLLPQRIEQLSWLGLSAQTLQRLQAYITLLPERTSVNLNTASPEVLYASVAGLDMAQAQRLVNARNLGFFHDLAEATRAMPTGLRPLDASRHSVASSYFEIRGRLRLGSLTTEDRSLVQRDGVAVKTLWRMRQMMEAPQSSSAAALH